jgi:hypothetical protein
LSPCPCCVCSGQARDEAVRPASGFLSHPPSLACVLFPGLVWGVTALHKIRSYNNYNTYRRGVTALHKIRSYNNYNTYRQPASFGSSALDVSRLPGPPQADSGRQRASRARTNDRKTSLPFIASGFTLRFSLLCSAMSGGSAVLGIPATSTVCAGLLFGFWSFFGIRGVVEC